ncbi:glycosyltransferase family 2 protein [Chitinophaga sp. 212800010-3]|uniref:glycosyltransferase family 2 protein n=1 Tax=unclassified Chitinophaga TaxID=2619133 RepID=UPI002E165EAD
MIQKTEMISPPSRRERFTLRLMIILGVCSLGYMMYYLLDKKQINYAPFYWVLIIGIAFNCLRVLHEWYHYFSITVPAPAEKKQDFTVDILTTFCSGEPYPMIVKTLTAIKAVQYPHTTWLCDEANDPYLIEICQQLGVRHVTRTTHENAKAGNINNALKQATGELCVVMDPDHVPAPGFLDPIVDHFNDPAVGFVQVVQAYSNLGDSLVAKGAAQQTFQFYGPIMATMNSYGTVLAIGANCTFRRKALDSIGGHAAGLSEDMHTAMQLHAKGWKSIYVPAVLTRGLVPSTMSAYYAQQLKWARGTAELLVTSYVKLFPNFTWRQQLHYGTIPFHYLSGFIFLINFLIPILSLITGRIPFHVDMVDFAVICLPAIASIFLVRHFVQRWVMEEEERGFHVVGGLLLIGTWWIYILGIVYTIIRKKVPYIPTPKDDSGADNWWLNIPNMMVLLASLGAIIYGLGYDWNPYSIAMATFAGVNCFIMAFNIIASFRLHRLLAQWPLAGTILRYPLPLKKQLWLFRHLHLYTLVRKLGLPLLLAVVFATWYTMQRNPEPKAGSMPTHMETGDKVRWSDLVAADDPPVSVRSHFHALPDTIRGLSYNKGVPWFKNRYALTRYEVNRDFTAMKALGVNTIRFFGPGIYDRNVLRVAAEQGIHLHYGFWIPDIRDMKEDRSMLNDLHSTILDAVTSLKNNPQITAWNIGNSALQRLSQQYYTPDQPYQQKAWLNWLQTLTAAIKTTDSSRPLTLEVELTNHINTDLQQLQQLLPAVDAFGIVAGADSSGSYQLATSSVPHYISEAPVPWYTRLTPAARNGFVAPWQDLETRDYVTFNGLTDHSGRFKPAYYQLGRVWGQLPAAAALLPELHILRPARATYPGSRLTYYALVKHDGQWTFPGDPEKGISFEWYLVKSDLYGNNIFRKKMGTGTSVTFPIPEKPDQHWLYLEAVKNGQVITTSSPLNTPVWPVSGRQQLSAKPLRE